MPYIIFSSITVISLISMVVLCRAYVKNMFNSVDDIFDDILNKTFISPDSKLHDTRLSKLRQKACRIMEIYVTDAALAQTEKETVQSFISDMSHQMKTPLSGISMYSELLSSNKGSEADRQNFAERIKGLSEKLQWMIDCLIKMSRLEIGAVELLPQVQKIGKTIGTAIESVISAAAKKNINISVEDFTDVELLHDSKWTAEAVTNILENAVKYSPVDSEISLSVEPLSMYTKIMITDHGIGIDKEDFNLIFKRFYRGENTKESQGAGLGLYLSSLIMEKQGGYIMVDSVAGEFTSFSLFLQNCNN